MKVLTIYSMFVVLSIFWNMTTIVCSAKSVSGEYPVSLSEYLNLQCMRNALFR